MTWTLPIVVGGAVVAAVAAFGEFKVTADKENVVASRLEGTWVPDVSLYERLKGTTPGNDVQALRFRSVPEVAGQIPAAYKQFFGERLIYMAGYVHWGDKEMPFVLMEHHGNPHIVRFREEDGTPYGDVESCNVALTPAKETKNDLLFIGGDFNNEPFRAYRRAEESSK